MRSRISASSSVVALRFRRPPRLNAAAAVTLADVPVSNTCDLIGAAQRSCAILQFFGWVEHVPGGETADDEEGRHSDAESENVDQGQEAEGW